MTKSPFFDKYPFKKKSADFIPIDELYTKARKGYCINGTHYTKVKDIFEHLLIIGSTGSGKSKKVIIPSIARINHSMVIYDPHKELYEVMADNLKNRGFTTQILNFTEVQSRFNPLAHIDPEKHIRWMGRLLVTAGREVDTRESHWVEKASALIASLIHLAYLMHDSPSLPQVYDLLLQAETNPKRVRQLFEKHEADTFYQKKFTAFTVNKTNEVASIFSTAAKALDDYSDATIRKVSSGDDIQPIELRQKPTVIFIQINPIQMDLYRKPVSVFLEVLWLNIQKKLIQNQLPVSFYIDEADTLYLPTLPSLLSQVRKYLISIVLVYQSHGQIKASHKDYQTIIENTKTHIYLGAQTAETAQTIEQQLGKIEGSDDYRAPREKLRIMDKDEALILTHGKPPIFTQTFAYYDQVRFNHLSRNKPLDDHAT